MFVHCILGENYLRQIYNVIGNNQEWIFSSLDIHEVLSEVSLERSLSFVPDITDRIDERAQARRNPLKAYNKIGNSQIDFVSTK